MKANKLFRKLALSGVALGAAAVTLTATTFAWYTSNTEADVTSVTGQTEAKGSDSLFIATAATYDTAGQVAQTWNAYKATATPILTGAKDQTANAYVLKPVYSNFGTIKAATTTPSAEAVLGRAYNKIKSVETTGAGTNESPLVSTVTYDDESASDFIEFVFRVKSGGALTDATPLYFSKFNITTGKTSEVATDTITQVAMANGGSTGVDDPGLYGADLIKALKLDVTSANVALENDGTIGDTGATTRLKGTGSTEANNVTTYSFDSWGSSSNLTVSDTANAVGYYNTVMGTNLPLTGPQGYVKGTDVVYVDMTAQNPDTSGKTAVSFASLPATTSGDDFSVLEVRFVLYLDGWDNYCYDVMQGQSVDFSFEITTTASSSCIYTLNS